MSVQVIPAKMEVPVWKVLTSTNAPAPRTGAALTASTKPRLVSTTKLTSETLCFVCICMSQIYYCLQCVHCSTGLQLSCFLPFCSTTWVERYEWSSIQPETSLCPSEPSPTLQLWCRLSHEWHLWQQYLSGWAVIMCYFNWSLWGNFPFAAPPHREARSATEQFPQAGALLNDISAGQLADVIGTSLLKRSPEYLKLLLL